MGTKKNKLFWRVLKEIFGAIGVLFFLFLIGIYLINMFPEWFWGEPLIDCAGVWECPEITIMSFGNSAYPSPGEARLYRKYAQGEVRLYGKKYFVEIAPAISCYDYRVYDVELQEIGSRGGNKETCIWEFEVCKMKKDTFSFTVRKDYLSVREGKAEDEKSSGYVGKKFVLKKQLQESELPTFYFQEKGTWKCDDLTIVSDGATENYPYSETNGTLRLNDKEYPLKIYNSAYFVFMKDLSSVRYKPEGGEWYAHCLSGVMYSQEDKLYLKIFVELRREKENDAWKAEKSDLVYVLEKQPETEGELS